MVGKDIVRFHAIYWPAFLMAANLNIPYQVLLTVGGQMKDKKNFKISWQCRLILLRA